MSDIVIKVVGLVLTEQSLTLYKEDGTTFVIQQGDNQLSRILNEARPFMNTNKPVEVTYFGKENSFSEFAEKSGGLVKFFRIAKSRLVSLFSNKEEPIVLGNTHPTIKPEESDQQEKAISQVLNNAKTVESKLLAAEAVESTNVAFSPTIEESSEDTIVAVVGDKIIPSMEKIQAHFTRANKLGSSIGVNNFLKRIAKVIDSRKHSIEDLLSFMEHADMPIADDGSIIAYKVLNKVSDEVFVDVHTGHVQQKIGSYVFMAESMVDPNRRADCSNGLHVARRKYIGSFSGSACVLIKFGPENVIAVPEYSRDKMRICGYLIIAQLSENDHRLLSRNEPFTNNTAAKKLLGAALSGNHTGIIQTVQITGEKGTNIIYKNVAPVPEPVKTEEAVIAPETVAVAMTPEKDQEHLIAAPPVNPKEIIGDLKADGQPTRREQALVLITMINKKSNSKAVRVKAGKELILLRKQAKVSWERLGLTKEDGERIAQLVK